MTTVLVPLAEGFEEIEAVTIVDVLRRAGFEVVVAGLSGAGPVLGSRGLTVSAEVDLADVVDKHFDAIALPGGLGGTHAMRSDDRLIEILQRHHGAGRLTAAICAAPLVLVHAGLVDNVAITSHPSVRGSLGAARICDGPTVVRAGNVLTSQGPGTAMDFSLALVDELGGCASELAEAMCHAPVATH